MCLPEPLQHAATLTLRSKRLRKEEGTMDPNDEEEKEGCTNTRTTITTLRPMGLASYTIC